MITRATKNKRAASSAHNLNFGTQFFIETSLLLQRSSLESGSHTASGEYEFGPDRSAILKFLERLAPVANGLVSNTTSTPLTFYL